VAFSRLRHFFGADLRRIANRYKALLDPLRRRGGGAVALSGGGSGTLLLAAGSWRGCGFSACCGCGLRSDGRSGFRSFSRFGCGLRLGC